MINMKPPAELFDNFQTDGRAIKDSIIKIRRRFHQYPEIGHREIQTTAILKKELARLGLDIKDNKLPTGLWAELDTGRPGPVVAVRSDIDALPVSEQTGLPFASKNDGRMHACGHDVHMAVLLGTARLLTRQKKNLVGRIKFICQPAEEIPPGGARPMIKAGVLKNPQVDAILALHVDPALPTGSIGIRDGATMASVYDFDIRVIGRSGHAALPHNTIDAIPIAAEIVSGLQQLISRKVDPVQPAVITFGTVKGGGTRNVIAGEVTLEGTARSLNPSLSKKLPGLIRKTASGIARAFGARVEIIDVADYPVLKSDPRINKFITGAFRGVYPLGKVYNIPEVLGGEDFACYLEKIPGAMFRLGVGNKKIGADKPWHHPAFIIDEEAIPVGYTTMAAAVAGLLYSWPGPTRKSVNR